MTDREHDQLLATATDRFERRLSEESANLRITMVQQDSATREEIASLRVATRDEMASLRVTTRDEIASLRVNMTGQFAASRIEHEGRHRELLKWAFVFWVGQAIAIAGMFKAFT
jgi:hypothetical protein